MIFEMRTYSFLPANLPKYLKHAGRSWTFSARQLLRGELRVLDQ